MGQSAEDLLSTAAAAMENGYDEHATAYAMMSAARSLIEINDSIKGMTAGISKEYENLVEHLKTRPKQ